jgi:hypothetical protein
MRKRDKWFGDADAVQVRVRVDVVCGVLLLLQCES